MMTLKDMMIGAVGSIPGQLPSSYMADPQFSKFTFNIGPSSTDGVIAPGEGTSISNTPSPKPAAPSQPGAGGMAGMAPSSSPMLPQGNPAQSFYPQGLANRSFFPTSINTAPPNTGTTGPQSFFPSFLNKQTNMGSNWQPSMNQIGGMGGSLRDTMVGMGPPIKRRG